MTSNSESLVKRAVALLDEIGERSQVNTELLSWITFVQKYGFEKACARQRELARKFTDSLVTEAIEKIAKADDRWPSLPEKIQEVARILAGWADKTEIRGIAVYDSKQPTAQIP
ncbi:hypothetical protein KW785_02300 [Candidatus Parcubacteria bacterium]|nr:hypothetical protein [Candidatus Parcubacteria bacterium]